MMLSRKQKEEKITKLNRKIFLTSASLPFAFAAAIINPIYLIPIPAYIIGILWYQRRIKQVRRSK